MWKSVLAWVRTPIVVGRFVVRQTTEFAEGLLHYVWRRLLSKPVAWPYKTIYVDPREIAAKVRRTPERRKWPLGVVVDGDWDRDLRRIEDTKRNAIFEHYVGGVPWAETALFRVRYRPLLHSEGRVKKCEDLGSLVLHYQNQMDAVFKNIQENGFLKARIFSRKIEPIYVHIGRGGEIIAYNGSHRLAIAMALDLPEVPVRVRARHRQWEEARKSAELPKHPDRTGLRGGGCRPSRLRGTAPKSRPTDSWLDRERGISHDLVQ